MYFWKADNSCSIFFGCHYILNTWEPWPSLIPEEWGLKQKTRFLGGQEGVQMFNDIDASIGIELSSLIEVWTQFLKNYLVELSAKITITVDKLLTLFIYMYYKYTIQI